MLEWLITIFGLAVFEIICSVDNAIVNAHVLKTLDEKFRRFFFTWGLFIAVFLVRGILPFIIVWIANPGLTLNELITSPFTNDEMISHSFETSKPLLLLGGGSYLFLIFLSWLFLEEKKYVFRLEKFIYTQSVWFYAWASVYITFIIYLAIQVNPILALAASIGVSAFFITDGFKQNAEKAERELLSGKSHLSSWGKIFYLEALDASFSIDGVIGAFAFTTSIPLILLGNGIGAIVIRQLTIKGIDRISKYAYLKNGAMYSIGILGIIMIMEAFGQEIAFWIAPGITFFILITFLYLSKRHLDKTKKIV